MTDRNFRGLLMPSDSPPRRSMLKRQLLFFDSVVLPDPSDGALLNELDIAVRSPQLEVMWTERVPYVRTADYGDVIREIFIETAPLRRDGKIEILTRDRAKRLIAPATHWTAFQLIVRDKDVVRSAVPDLYAGPPSVALRSGIYQGAAAIPGGVEDPFPVPPGEAVEIDSQDKRWSAVAWSRVGRTMKYLRIAGAAGYVPIAVDDPTALIMAAVGKRAYEPIGAAAKLADAAIAADVVDAESLDRALIELSWPEVLRLRRHVLPAVARVRTLLLRRARLISRTAPMKHDVLAQELGKIRGEYDRAQDELAKRWTESKLGLVTRTAMMAGTGLVGLATLALPAAISAVTSLAAALTVTGVLTPALVAELKGWLAARDAVRSHPLFFFDRLPAQIPTLVSSKRGD